MARINELFSYAHGLMEKNIKLILVHINEAHTSKWKIGLKNHPEPHKSFEDRLHRTREFVNKYNPPYDIYIDKWTNEYDNKYASWPDKYLYVNDKLKIIAKSEYGTDGNMDGVIVKDITEICREIINS
jgi:hypothetical protein